MNLSKLLKKEVIFIILSIVAILIVFLGISYAFLASDSTGTSFCSNCSEGIFLLSINLSPFKIKKGDTEYTVSPLVDYHRIPLYKP